MKAPTRYCSKCKKSYDIHSSTLAVCPFCNLPTELRPEIRLGNPVAISVIMPPDTEEIDAADLAGQLISQLHAVTLSDTDEVLYCRDGVYLRGGEARIAAAVEAILQEAGLRKKATINFVREVIGHVKRRTYVDRDQFDSKPQILNLKNGLLDVETFEFTPHTPEHHSLVQFPVRFDPNADCPGIKKFISEVSYPEDKYLLQEYAGYLLWKGYPAAKALILVGDGGNGKSTLIGILKALIGIHNISSRSLTDLEFNRFAKAELHGKAANLYADLADKALQSVGQFKMLTGGDPITGEKKFQNAFTFVNFAKLVFSANKIPEVYEDTTAFFRRWIIITFPNSFEGSDKENRNLLQELTTEQELSGFLVWVLEGLKRLRSAGWRFSNSRSTEEVREEYIRKSSPTRAFLMDCTLENPNSQVPKKELFAAYCEYCRANKLPVVSQETFFKTLPKFVKIQEARPEIDGKRVRCFIGLELKPRERWGSKTDEEDGGSGTLVIPEGGHGGHGGQDVVSSVHVVQDVQGAGLLSSHSITEERRRLLLRLCRELDQATQITKQILLHDVTSQDSSAPDWFDAVWDSLVKDGLLLRDGRGIWRLSK